MIDRSAVLTPSKKAKESNSIFTLHGTGTETIAGTKWNV